MNLACLVTGDRNATPDRWWEIMCNRFDWFLDYVQQERDRVVVIHGAACGIDALADQYFRVCQGVAIERFPADWNQYGKGAGPRRNRAMLDRLLAFQQDGYRCGVMAFHDDLEHSKGTGGMVRMARAADVPVLTYTSGPQRTTARGPRKGARGEQ